MSNIERWIEWVADGVSVPRIRRRVEAALTPSAAPLEQTSTLVAGAQRSVILLEGCIDDPPLLLKRHRVGSGLHPFREGLKRRVGLSGPRREWRCLRALHAAGVAAATPLALMRTRDGDEWIVQSYVSGRPLALGLDGDRQERRALLDALASEVHRAHAAGFAHGDLHLGNVLATPDGVTLLDWQRGRRVRPGAASQYRDLGSLDFALAQHGVSRADRVRVRLAALGAPRDAHSHSRAAVHDQLRRVGRASRSAARRHWRVRARQSLRRDGRVAPFDAGELRGVRAPEIDPGLLISLLEAHRAEVAQRGEAVVEHSSAHVITSLPIAGRHFRIHEAWREASRSVIRGAVLHSTADRIWHAAHALRARGFDTARPIARLERRRLGLPLHSICILEHNPHGERQRRPALAIAEREARLLGRQLALLHLTGVSGARLDPAGVEVVRHANGQPTATLLALESVRVAARPVAASRRMSELTRLSQALESDTSSASPSAAGRTAYDAASSL